MNITLICVNEKVKNNKTTFTLNIKILRIVVLYQTRLGFKSI